MIDCHAHIIDRHRFPFLHGTYQPTASEWSTVERYLSVLDTHGISHAVLVQPTSAYDYDHACMLHALGVGEGRLRGIARIRVDRIATDESLLDHPLIVGARADFLGDGVAIAETREFDQLLAALRKRSLVLEIQSEGDHWETIWPKLKDAGVTLVVDHCGRPEPERGLAQPGFNAVLEMGRAGHFVKLSGLFRFSRQPYPHGDADPFVKALLEAFTPQRCVWGSDWPFLKFAERVDYSRSLSAVSRLVDDTAPFDAAARRLFGFAA